MVSGLGSELRGKRGRPRAFDSEVALEGAMQLFWRHGYEATSLAALLDAMGIGRSSFYQSFGSKHEVFVRAVDRYREQLLVYLQASLEQAPSGWDFIEQSLQSVSEGASGPDGRRGCLIFNTAAELGLSDAEIAARVSASIDAFSEVFARAARRAQKERSLARGRDPDFVARQVVVAMSGLQTMAKAGVSRKELRALAQAAADGIRSAKPR